MKAWTSLLVISLYIVPFCVGANAAQSDDEPRHLLLQEECLALAAQPALRTFFGIKSCKEERNTCEKCNDLATMRFTGDRLSFLSCPYRVVPGHLPPEWRVMKELTTIRLQVDHKTISSLPPQWSELAKLTSLTLINGCLNGSLPDEWSAMTSLKSLSLQYNELVGTLPASWSTLVNLEELDLSGNMLEGTLPASWSTMTQLSSLKLSRNWITGSVPAAWGNMQELIQLDLKHNELSGYLPAGWSSLQKLASMHLSSNKLSGTIPASWSNMTSLLVLTLGWNRLCGPLPDGAFAAAAQQCASSKWPGAVGSLLSCDLLSLQHVAHAYSSSSAEQRQKQRVRGDGSLGAKPWEDVEPLPDEFAFQNGTDSPIMNIDPPRLSRRRPFIKRVLRWMKKRLWLLVALFGLAAAAAGVVVGFGWHQLQLKDVVTDLNQRKEILKALLSRSPQKYRVDRRG